ncbi:MAG TPA: histidine kinase dimerization/phosphoacceptor domain -containing protein [Alphaproteobacteria bacterium]|nr:histidine kinase dimerization/phosphoacceptor domain -containing protein [Alphaproteobacteria bacterium]
MPDKQVRSIRSRLTLALAILLVPVVSYVVVGWSYTDETTTARLVLIFGPIALWLFTLLVVWLATDLQIGRPIRRMTRTAKAYSDGDLAVRASLIGPAEMRALAGTFNDMAERIAGREQELREAIETREAMMREIHHRVKNNLQIVTSLLNLQAKAVEGESAQRAFNDIQTRVRALALVHRYLYESEDLQSVNLGAFLKELAASLQLSYGVSQEQVAIEVDADEVWDVSDRAVPLALFMTEAMSNALKHAFPQGRQGVIRVVLKSMGESVVRFSVEDNGIGLSEAQAAAQGTQASLGMSLIKAFARQVDGKLTISGPPGTTVTIEFVNKFRPYPGVGDAVRNYAWAV